MDRLLGNPLLYAELPLAYAALAAVLLRRCDHPIVLVDSVEVRPNKYALSASIAFDGRGFPIYAIIADTVAPKPRVLQRFLSGLSRVLPADCRPVLVTDAAFQAPWFDAIEERGWNYVGRIRGRVQLSLDQETWLPVDAIYTRARGHATNLGRARFPKSTPRDRRVVLSKKPVSKHRKRLSRRGKPGKRRNDLEHGKAAREPWLITTSLSCRPSAVVAIYSMRMQIEQNYRDQKNHRWGWSLRHCGCRSDSRIAILLLIASIACFVQQAAGVAAEQLQLHYQQQANTIRDRRVLSFFVLGSLVLNSSDQRDVLAHLGRGLQTIQTNIGRLRSG